MTKPIPLLQGTLDLIVLEMLRAEPTNGYDLAQRIQAVSRDVLHVNAGSLYPALYRLEERGWLSSYWSTSENNRRAKFYRLTAAGKKHLQREANRWRRMARAIGLVMGQETQEAES